MINLKENNFYAIQQHFYELFTLECTCIQNGIAWLWSLDRKHCYKLDIKSNKLYYFNKACQLFDSVDNTLRDRNLPEGNLEAFQNWDRQFD